MRECMCTRWRTISYGHPKLPIRTKIRCVLRCVHSDAFSLLPFWVPCTRCWCWCCCSGDSSCHCVLLCVRDAVCIVWSAAVVCACAQRRSKPTIIGDSGHTIFRVRYYTKLDWSPNTHTNTQPSKIAYGSDPTPFAHIDDDTHAHMNKGQPTAWLA